MKTRKAGSERKKLGRLISWSQSPVDTCGLSENALVNAIELVMISNSTNPINVIERGVSGRFFNFGVKNKVRGVFVGAVLVSLALSE
ncbi:hypothetical protein ACFX2A_045381 [Malus domestica]